MNYLVRLGWSHGDQEIFSREELLQLFNVEQLNSSPSAFDPEKLNWLSAHYIKAAPAARLAVLLAAQLEKAGHAVPDPTVLEPVVPLFQPRAKTLSEMAEQAAIFVLPDHDLPYDLEAVAKFLTPETRELLRELRGLLAELPSFDKASLEAAFPAWLEARELKFKVLAQPMRVALTGRTASPGLFEMMEVLGRERTLTRLDKALSL